MAISSLPPPVTTGDCAGQEVRAQILAEMYSEFPAVQPRPDQDTSHRELQRPSSGPCMRDTSEDAATQEVPKTTDRDQENRRIHTTDRRGMRVFQRVYKELKEDVRDATDAMPWIARKPDDTGGVLREPADPKSEGERFQNDSPKPTDLAEVKPPPVVPVNVE